MAGRVDTVLVNDLRRIALFAELGAEHLEPLVPHVSRRALARGEILFRAGEPGDALYAVLSGCVHIFLTTPQGEDLVNELGAGECFGEMALITGEPRSGTAVAATETVVIALACATFRDLIRHVPALALSLTETLSHRLRAQMLHPRRRPSSGSRRRVGLALSAGGAKGLAHLGALRCFEREGMAFDLIAGTSIGAVIGALWSMGRTSSELVAGFRELAQSLRRTLLDFAVPEIALTRGEKKRAAIRAQTGDLEIGDLATPFWAVAADLLSGREAVLGSGPLWQALDATTAIPAIFPPVTVTERLLVDGWVTNPLPTDVLRRAGADVIVAVDTSLAIDPAMRSEDLLGREHGGRLGRWRGHLANATVLRIALRSMEIGARERTLANLAVADVCVRPELAGFSVTDTAGFDEIVERGEAAAERALPTIRAAVDVKTP